MSAYEWFSAAAAAAEIAELESVVEQYELDFNEFKLQLEAANEIIDDLRSQERVLVKNLELAEERRARSEAEKDSLEYTLGQKYDEISALQKEITELRSSVANLRGGS